MKDEALEEAKEIWLTFKTNDRYPYVLLHLDDGRYVLNGEVVEPNSELSAALVETLGVKPGKGCCLSEEAYRQYFGQHQGYYPKFCPECGRKLNEQED